MDVKPVIYLNSWFIHNHVTVTQWTHLLNNITQSVLCLSSNRLITSRICILHNTTITFESHNNLKIHKWNKEIVQSKTFLITVLFIFHKSAINLCKMLKIFTLVQYTTFWYDTRFVTSLWSCNLLLVHRLCIKLLNVKNFKLCAKNVIKDNVKWPAMSSYFNALKIGVHELLELTAVLIPIIFLCNWKTLFMPIELTPTYYVILHYC